MVVQSPESFRCYFRHFNVPWNVPSPIPDWAEHFWVSPPEALVDLMATLVRMCPSVCESSHFAVLLGAYSATLNILGKGRELVGCIPWCV